MKSLISSDFKKFPHTGVSPSPFFSLTYALLLMLFEILKH